MEIIFYYRRCVWEHLCRFAEKCRKIVAKRTSLQKAHRDFILNVIYHGVNSSFSNFTKNMTPGFDETHKNVCLFTQHGCKSVANFFDFSLSIFSCQATVSLWTGKHRFGCMHRNIFAKIIWTRLSGNAQVDSCSTSTVIALLTLCNTSPYICHLYISSTEIIGPIKIIS